MKSSITAAVVFALALTLAPLAAAQRPHVADTQTNSPASVPPAPAPPTVPAKYEGGMLGYSKAKGFITFDDVNGRLLFQDQQRREVFSIGYSAILAIWPDTKSQTSTAGRVIAGVVPYGLGLPALLVKNKTRYLVVQYRDPDIAAAGITSFKLESKETLHSFLHTLGQKAQMTQRGDAYIRRAENTGAAKP